jgi:hypothetical protein
VAQLKAGKSPTVAAIHALVPVVTAIIRVGGEIMVAWLRYIHH